MPEVTRYDSFPLRGARRTDAGGLVVPAAVARTGIQVYTDATGRKVREYRDPAEVFAAESLATLPGAPVTIMHPAAGRVDAKTVRNESHGTVLSVAGRETIDGDDFVLSEIAVSGETAVARVDSRELAEVSCGYRCDTIDEPGMTPDGKPFDRRQTKIRYNHVALIPAGHARAGSNARLRLDSAGNQVKGSTMAIRFKGESFDTATESGCAALQSRLDAADAAMSAVTAERDVSVAALATARTKLDAYGQAETVRVRTALIESVKPILGAEYTGADKTDTQIRRDAIAKLVPDLKIRNDADDTYIAAAFDLAMANKPAENYRADAAPVVSSRAKMMTDHQASLRSLFSKGDK